MKLSFPCLLGRMLGDTQPLGTWLSRISKGYSVFLNIFMGILDLNKGSSFEEWREKIPLSLSPYPCYVYIMTFDGFYIEMVQVLDILLFSNDFELIKLLQKFDGDFRIVCAASELEEGLFQVNTKKLIGEYGMKVEDLFEIQLRTRLTEFGLNDRYKNKLWASVLINNENPVELKHRKFRSGVNLFYGDKDIIKYNYDVYGLVDIDKTKALYMVAFSKENDHGCIVQNLLWRTKDGSYKNETDGLAEDIFFELFLEKRGSVCIKSDNFQTRKGKAFWIKMVKSAFEKKLFVYLYNRESGRLFPVKSLDSLYNKKIDIWGYGTRLDDETPNPNEPGLNQNEIKNREMASNAIKRQKFSKKKESRMGRVRERTLIISKKPMS